MPYRNTHWIVLVLIIWAGYAFWPSYLSQLPAATTGMHVHGVTALLWMILLAAQSWTIQNRQRDAHRLLGYASFGLFPIVLGGMGFLDVAMAQKFAAGANWYKDYGPRFGATDIIAQLGMAYFYFMALRMRKNVRLHSGYMIMTIIFLVGTLINRSLGDILSLLSNSDFDLQTSMAVRIANLVVIASLLIARRFVSGDTRPIRDAALLVGLHLMVWETIGIWSVWRQIFALFAQIDPFLLGGAGFLLGVVATFFGWQSGSKSRQTPRKALPSRVLQYQIDESPRAATGDRQGKAAPPVP